MSEHVFFYGTLMTPFNRPGRQRVDTKMAFAGRGTIQRRAVRPRHLSGRVPSADGSVVWGEVYEMHDPTAVLAALDEIEGYRANEPERSLYTRVLTDVTLDDGRTEPAWAYFYNAPLGRAQRIESGDYLEHLNVKSS